MAPTRQTTRRRTSAGSFLRTRHQGFAACLVHDTNGAYSQWPLLLMSTGFPLYLVTKLGRPRLSLFAITAMHCSSMSVRERGWALYVTQRKPSCNDVLPGILGIRSKACNNSHSQYVPARSSLTEKRRRANLALPDLVQLAGVGERLQRMEKQLQTASRRKTSKYGALNSNVWPRTSP